VQVQSQSLTMKVIFFWMIVLLGCAVAARAAEDERKVPAAPRKAAKPTGETGEEEQDVERLLPSTSQGVAPVASRASRVELSESDSESEHGEETEFGTQKGVVRVTDDGLDVVEVTKPKLDGWFDDSVTDFFTKLDQVDELSWEKWLDELWKHHGEALGGDGLFRLMMLLLFGGGNKAYMALAMKIVKNLKKRRIAQAAKGLEKHLKAWRSEYMKIFGETDCTSNLMRRYFGDKSSANRTGQCGQMERKGQSNIQLEAGQWQDQMYDIAEEFRTENLGLMQRVARGEIVFDEADDDSEEGVAAGKRVREAKEDQHLERPGNKKQRKEYEDDAEMEDADLN